MVNCISMCFLLDAYYNLHVPVPNFPSVFGAGFGGSKHALKGCLEQGKKAFGSSGLLGLGYVVWF